MVAGRRRKPNNSPAYSAVSELIQRPEPTRLDSHTTKHAPQSTWRRRAASTRPKNGGREEGNVYVLPQEHHALSLGTPTSGLLVLDTDATAWAARQRRRLSVLCRLRGPRADCMLGTARGMPRAVG